MDLYLSGERLYGDDFTLDQIKQWYKEESEGYADLGNKERVKYVYSYHELNKTHAYNKMKDKLFENALGFGSAWGDEFEPILDKITNLTIIEPSENLRNNKIGNLTPSYIKPEIDGVLKFRNCKFDLITCFGTLHHIPNVSFVLKELIRVLKPGGYLLVREPIISMGDWRNYRVGLTRNERGIPVSFFESVFANEPVKIVSRTYCFTMTSFLQRKLGKFFKKSIFSYKIYIKFDKFISQLLKFNVHYNAEKKIHIISPQNVFYVIKKV